MRTPDICRLITRTIYIDTPIRHLPGLRIGHIHARRRNRIYSDLGLWNEDMKYVVESGKFNLMIGRSVEDIRIKNPVFLTVNVNSIS